MARKYSNQTGQSVSAIVIVAAMTLSIWGCGDDEPNPVVPPSVEDPGLLSLDRTSWLWASAPLAVSVSPENPGVLTTFDPEDRVEAVRWFSPRERTLRRYLNPDLIDQERDETVPTMDLYLRTDDETWEPDTWGGIMRGLRSPCGPGLDLAEMVYWDIWVNDGFPNPADRSGRLHIDFGYISEDGFWPDDDEGDIEFGTWQREDGIIAGFPDGVFFAPEEDIGLDGNEWGPQLFNASYEIQGDTPYPRINGTARNAREDSEDLDGNTRLNLSDGYFTVVIDLKETPAQVDVVQDFENVQDLVDQGLAWRKYSFHIFLSDVVDRDLAPNLSDLHQLRIWFEDDLMPSRSEVQLQISAPWFHDILTP